MRFAMKFRLSVAASAAAALAACSGAGAGTAGNGASGSGASAARNESVAAPVNFASEDGPFELARSLCIDSAVRRFGIAAGDVTGASFGGGGETPQSLEGQASIDLFGPPARHFNCAIAGGAVTSLSEVDERGNPVAARN